MESDKKRGSWEVGKSFRIKSLSGPHRILERLWELGFTTGEVLTVLHKTPFGGPLIIKVRDTSVALRKLELECIWID